MPTSDITIAIIAAGAAITGSLIPIVFNHLNRRQEFKRILFDKKFSVYAALVGESAKIASRLYTRREDEDLSQYPPDSVSGVDIDMFLTLIFENKLILTPDVASLAMDFAGKFEIKADIDTLITETGVIHQALDKQCRKELGIKALERELYKLG